MRIRRILCARDHPFCHAHTSPILSTRRRHEGLTPRICNELFQRIAENQDPNVKFRVECSYMEIYNERVRDLLAMSDKKVRHFEALYCEYVGG